MKCSECGYEHNPSAENWTYLENSTYEINSNIFTAEMLKEMVEHALLLNPSEKGIYIDTCLMDTQSCLSCQMQILRNPRSEIEREYRDRGMTISYFF